MFADMAAQLLDPCAQERDKRLDELAERLDAVARLDSSSGAVDLDEDALRAVVWEYAPNDVESNVKEFTSLAKDGFATLGDNAVLPFRLLADPLRASEYLAPEALEALGVESGADPDRLAADLQARYPSAPETVLDRSNLTALIQVAEGLAAARSLEIAWSERVRADRSALEQLASTPSVEESWHVSRRPSSARTGGAGRSVSPVTAATCSRPRCRRRTFGRWLPPSKHGSHLASRRPSRQPGGRSASPWPHTPSTSPFPFAPT